MTISELVRTRTADVLEPQTPLGALHDAAATVDDDLASRLRHEASAAV